MMDNLDFSEEEIQEQLSILGYRNIPKQRLREFKQDLDELIRHGDWKSLTPSAHINSTRSRPSPPAYTKEKVSRCYFKDAGEGFFLHPSKEDHERRVLSTCQNRDQDRQQEPWDSYARHSVAPALQLPADAPTRLQVEPDPEDAGPPSLTDASYASSPGPRFIKRKVLRKQNGQSLVCEESFYSEDSDPSPQREERSRDTMSNAERDEDSLGSSFWSDREKQEDEEEVEVRRVLNEDSKLVAKDVDSLQEDSDKPETNHSTGGGSSTGESSEDDDEEEGGGNEEDSESGSQAEETLQEDSKEKDGSNEEEEEEENEPVVDEEDLESGADAEDSLQEEEKEMSNQENFTVESSEDGTDGDDEDDGDDEEENDQVGNGESEVMAEESLQDEDRQNEEEEERVVDEESGAQEEEEKAEGNTWENFTRESSDDDGDDEDDGEEEVEIEGAVHDEDSHQEEEEPEVTSQENLTGERLNNGRDDEDGDDHGGDDEAETKAVVNEESPTLPSEVEDPHQEEEQPEVTSQEILKYGDDDDDDEDEEENCSSPAASLMTSGYGTYRPEEQEGGDYRDEQESRGVLSEEEEEGRSESSCRGFHQSPLEDQDQPEFSPRDQVEARDTKPESREPSEERSEGQGPHHHDGGFASEEKRLEDHRGPSEGRPCDEEARDLREEQNNPEAEDPDQDVKLVDSWRSRGRIWEEGNLRPGTDVASSLLGRLEELDLSAETENEDATQGSEEEEDDDGVSLSVFESYVRSMTRPESDDNLGPKSFIRPVMSKQTLKKTDPVNRYYEYKQFWDMFKPPGEADRRNIRWELKERLAYQPPPPKPRRVYVPNTYIVPTEKKRPSLRWEIKSKLANGVTPHKYNYRL